jgi:hypothetical protein
MTNDSSSSASVPALYWIATFLQGGVIKVFRGSRATSMIHPSESCNLCIIPCTVSVLEVRDPEMASTPPTTRHGCTNSLLNCENFNYPTREKVAMPR